MNSKLTIEDSEEQNSAKPNVESSNENIDKLFDKPQMKLMRSQTIDLKPKNNKNAQVIQDLNPAEQAGEENADKSAAVNCNAKIEDQNEPTSSSIMTETTKPSLLSLKFDNNNQKTV